MKIYYALKTAYMLIFFGGVYQVYSFFPFAETYKFEFSLVSFVFIVYFYRREDKRKPVTKQRVLSAIAAIIICIVAFTVVSEVLFPNVTVLGGQILLLACMASVGVVAKKIRNYPFFS